MISVSFSFKQHPNLILLPILFETDIGLYFGVLNMEAYRCVDIVCVRVNLYTVYTLIQIECLKID